MVFDADVHLSVTEKNGLTAEEALRAMDRAGIDRANIWLQPPYMREIEEANRYIYEAWRNHPDRFLPQAGLILTSGLAAQRKCSAVAWKITACMP